VLRTPQARESWLATYELLNPGSQDKQHLPNYEQPHKGMPRHPGGTAYCLTHQAVSLRCSNVGCVAMVSSALGWRVRDHQQYPYVHDIGLGRTRDE